MKNVIYITAMREGYAIDQIHRTMTVRELMACAHRPAAGLSNRAV